MFILTQIYTPHKKTSVKSLLSAREISGASELGPISTSSWRHTLPGRGRARTRSLDHSPFRLYYGSENKLHSSLLKGDHQRPAPKSSRAWWHTARELEHSFVSFIYSTRHFIRWWDLFFQRVSAHICNSRPFVVYDERFNDVFNHQYVRGFLCDCLITMLLHGS